MGFVLFAILLAFLAYAAYRLIPDPLNWILAGVLVIAAVWVLVSGIGVFSGDGDVDTLLPLAFLFRHRLHRARLHLRH